MKKPTPHPRKQRLLCVLLALLLSLALAPAAVQAQAPGPPAPLTAHLYAPAKLFVDSDFLGPAAYKLKIYDAAGQAVETVEFDCNKFTNDLSNEFWDSSYVDWVDWEGDMGFGEFLAAVHPEYGETELYYYHNGYGLYQFSFPYDPAGDSAFSYKIFAAADEEELTAVDFDLQQDAYLDDLGAPSIFLTEQELTGQSFDSTGFTFVLTDYKGVALRPYTVTANLLGQTFLIPARNSSKPYYWEIIPNDPKYSRGGGDLYWPEPETGVPHSIGVTVCNISNSPCTIMAVEKKAVTIKVTAGANLAVHNKGASHFTTFGQYEPEQVEYEQDGYDIYHYKIDATTQCHYEAGGADAAGRTDFVRQVQAFSLSYDNSGDNIITVDLARAGDLETFPLPTAYAQTNDLYLNVNDDRVLELAPGQTFRLHPIRVWQAMIGVTANYFVEPDYRLEIIGDSVTALRTGSSGRELFDITGQSPGLSIIKLTYDPVVWLTDSFRGGEYYTRDALLGRYLRFDAIDPENTGVVIVKVTETPYATDGLETGIEQLEYDTIYFDRLSGHGEYSFQPRAAAPISVSVHAPLHSAAWGSAWTDYAPDPDGGFTVRLDEGRNIIRVSAGEEVRYHVVNALAVDVAIQNNNNPDWQPGDPFLLGETAVISFTGLKLPIQKIAGIYNPGYPAGTWTQYETADGRIIQGMRTQYGIGEDNTIHFLLTEPGTVTLRNGTIHASSLGSGLGKHRLVEGGIPPNFNASSGTGLYSTLPDLNFTVLSSDYAAEQEKMNYAALKQILYMPVNIGTGVVDYSEEIKDLHSNRNVNLGPRFLRDVGDIISLRFAARSGDLSAFASAWLGQKPEEAESGPVDIRERTDYFGTDILGWSGFTQVPAPAAGDVGYAELTLTPPVEKGYPLTYTFRRAADDSQGLYPYITDLTIKPAAGEFLNFFDGKLLAVDAGQADLGLGWGYIATRERFAATVPHEAERVRLTAAPLEEAGVVTTVSMQKAGGETIEGPVQEIALDVGENTVFVTGTIGPETITREIIITREAAPVNFTVATVEGGRLSIRKPSGVRVIPNEDGTYPLPVASGYSYIYERPGYVTVVGTFEVTAAMTAGTEITLAAPAVPVTQAAGQARVTVLAADETLFRDAAVSFDPATAPDLAGRGYLPYNPGGYTVLNALVDALESDHSFFVGFGDAGVDFTVTPVEGVLEEVAGFTLAEGESWICELGGAVIDDYAHTLVPPGADIVLYRSSGAVNETLLRLTPGESTVPRGESVALSLTGRAAGAGGPAAAVAGAAILIDRQPTDYVTDDAGQVTIDTGHLSLNYHTIEAALPDVPTLNTSATIRVTKPADAATTNTVSLRLIGAEPPEQEGYGPWFDYRNWIATDEYELSGESVTAAEVFRAVTARHGLEADIRFEGNYISAIQAPQEFGGEYLAESDAGGFSGWMYTLNGEYPDYGIAEQMVSPGDELVFHYIADPIREFSRHWLYVEDVNPSAYRPPVPEAGTVEETLTPAVAITATESGAPAAAVTVAAGDVQAAVTEALAKAAAEEARGETATTAVKIEVAIPGDSGLRPEEVAEVYVTLPAEAVEILTGQDGGGGVDSLKIESALGEIELERAALSAAYSGDGLSLVLSRLTTETAAAEELQPPENTDVQIYEVRLYGVTDDTQVTSFGNGRVKISLPYDLPAGETIVVWHVQPGIPA
ncbi:MAG: DUF4430 domain-containing protein, partial [Gracilibacteraceae bacterium]|nr:DUF4430 domain-containing protein [Gracilibacteraceae bacterium]